MSRAGWRYFVCDECQQEWKESTRDRFSPSGVDCGCCGDWAVPSDYVEDESLKLSSSGNLLKYEIIIVKDGIK